jgi:hypothetical protein
MVLVVRLLLLVATRCRTLLVAEFLCLQAAVHAVEGLLSTAVLVPTAMVVGRSFPADKVLVVQHQVGRSTLLAGLEQALVAT